MRSAHFSYLKIETIQEKRKEKKATRKRPHHSKVTRTLANTDLMAMESVEQSSFHEI